MKNKNHTPELQLIGAWRFQRPAWHRHRCRSTPGHLLHLVEKGNYRLRLSGCEYRLQAGDVVYYYESEEVIYQGETVPVDFLSIAFLSSLIAPLPLNRRVISAEPGLQQAFRKLVSSWQQGSGVDRELRLLHQMSGLLLEWRKAAGTIAPQSEHEATICEQLEAYVRARRHFRPSLDELSQVVGVSPATLLRLCRRERSTTPMQLIKDLRMYEASGLLRHSMQGIGDIADYLGYSRIHEFSREFSNWAGMSPSHFRAEATDEF